jgi:GMP synthase (glutamine-hydrolysing)
LTERPSVLLLEHVSPGPPDAYALELATSDVELVRIRPDLGEPIPDWRQFSGLIATGGPMSAFDEASHPWLIEEKRAIRQAAHAGVPFWGVCLGAQILAASLGAEVWRGPAPEVGMRTVRLTPEAAHDPVFRGASPEVHTFEWHMDTFALPAEARLLATAEQYPNQAFAWRNAYGVQFHLESSPESSSTGRASRPAAPRSPWMGARSRRCWRTSSRMPRRP